MCGNSGGREGLWVFGSLGGGFRHFQVLCFTVPGVVCEFPNGEVFQVCAARVGGVGGFGSLRREGVCSLLSKPRVRDFEVVWHKECRIGGSFGCVWDLDMRSVGGSVREPTRVFFRFVEGLIVSHLPGVMRGISDFRVFLVDAW